MYHFPMLSYATFLPNCNLSSGCYPGHYVCCKGGMLQMFMLLPQGETMNFQLTCGTGVKMGYESVCCQPKISSMML